MPRCRTSTCCAAAMAACTSCEFLKVQTPVNPIYRFGKVASSSVAIATLLACPAALAQAAPSAGALLTISGSRLGPPAQSGRMAFDRAIHATGEPVRGFVVGDPPRQVRVRPDRLRAGR